MSSSASDFDSDDSVRDRNYVPAMKKREIDLVHTGKSSKAQEKKRGCDVAPSTSKAGCSSGASAVSGTEVVSGKTENRNRKVSKKKPELSSPRCTSKVGCSSDLNADSGSEEVVCKNATKGEKLIFHSFFRITEEDNKGNLKAECLPCEPKRVVLKGGRSVTSNFLKHLKRKHPENYQSYLAAKEGDRDVILGKRSHTSISKQENFEVNMAKFFASSLCPFTILSNRYLKKSFEGTGLKLMSRRSVLRRVDELYTETLTSLKCELQKQAHFCTTADIWSSKRRSFLGVTCHWIDGNFQRHSAALACRRFAGTHNYERVARLIEEIHSSFGLDENNVVSCVTDNGSNFVKAFKEYGIILSEQVLKMDLGFLDSEDRDSLDMEIEIPDFEKDVVLPKHTRCASHTLSLIATTDFAKAINSSTVLKAKQAQVFAKCSNLWNKAGRPKANEVVTAVLGHTLSYPGVTRWNSTFDALTKILSCRDKLGTLCERLGIASFTDSDLLYLEEYCAITKPLAEALDFLQGEKHCFLGYLLPTLATIKAKFGKLLATRKVLILQSVVKDLEDSLIERFRSYFELQPNAMDALLASFAIPSIKCRWFNVLRTTAKNITLDMIHQTVIKAMKTLYVEKVRNVEVNSNEQEAVTQTCHEFFDFNEDGTKTMSFLSNCVDNFPATVRSKELPENVNGMILMSVKKNNVSAASNQPENVIDTEFYKYMTDARTEIDILSEFPVMKKLFLRYNTALPSSAPVERLFSFAEILNGPRRNAMSDENFEKLVVLKSIFNNE